MTLCRSRRRDIVLATTNCDKAAELKPLLRGLPVRVRTLADFPGAPRVREDGRTLADNALKKAWSAARFTGLPALADDTGLFVNALGGAPGVRSARYAGYGATYDDNVRKLLRSLRTTPGPRPRGSAFRCAVALALPNGRSWVRTGSVRGRIVETPRGRGGFGYDPVFLVCDLGKTYAELPARVKNRISHRALAMVRMRPVLDRLARKSNVKR